jgi:putative DNA primase/helicase
LPELREALAQDRPILIVEGEKDVLALASLGITATCNAGGAGKWSAELSEYLRGTDAIIVADNDGPGHAHACEVVATLQGVARRVRVLDLATVWPKCPDKGDISDWIADGGTAEQLWGLVEAAPEWAFGPSAVDEKARAKAAESEQCLIDELARASQLEYDRRRTDAARELGVRRSTLDDVREARRASLAAAQGSAPLFSHWVVEAWPDEVDGDALIRDIQRRIRRHVVLTLDQATTVALWILLAWAHSEVAVHSPILLATSAEAGSGKTTLIDLIGLLAPRGLSCVGISEAALFRSIEQHGPTIVIDEADVALVDNEPLRAVVNSGWTRGSGVLRCVGDDKTPHLFPTFTPKVIGLKGLRLPDTTTSRCIIIELKRRKPTEAAERFRHIDDSNLADLRRQAMRWTADNTEALKAAAPEMPAGFDNRLGDNWQLLLAIADAAGGEWPELGRRGAIAIAKALDANDASVSVRLLADIKAILEEQRTDRIASARLVGLLGIMEDRPWPEWKGGKPLTQNGLARLLRSFGICPDTIRIGETTAKGYLLSQFKDAFDRYLGGPLEP